MTRLADRIKETSSTTGSGSVALAGAVAGFRGFLAVLGAGAVYYTIAHQSLAEWEVGIGTLSASPDTLARTTVLASSNAGAAVNFSAGLKDVFCTAPARVFGKASLLLSPEAAMLPATNFPELKRTVGTNWLDYALGFDQTTQERCYWRAALPGPVIFTGATLRVFSRQAAATTGTVGWVVTTLARDDGDAWDAAGYSDTVPAASVKGTAGQVLEQSVTLTTTGWAPGALLFAALARDVANDTVAEDAELLGAVIELN
jgi:hypothetical protein